MPAARNSKSGGARTGILRTISTPLGFYVLSLNVKQECLQKTERAETNAMSWQQTVTDPDEIKVFMALDGPEYTWRTMSAIARQTGLSEARVAQILAKYNLKLTRLSETPSVSGSALVGLIEKVGA